MSRGRLRRPHALAEALDHVSRPLSRRRGFADGLVIDEWAKIVGDRLAAECVPEQLRFPPRQRLGGTLRIRVGSGGLALELQHLQTQLIERINTCLGSDTVSRLHFVQGPVPAPPRPRPSADLIVTPKNEEDVARAVEGVDDADLRAALTALGRSVFARAMPK